MFTLIVIGEKGNLLPRVARKRARLTARGIANLPPHEVVELSIFGYDDDARELWDIVEARDYFIAFAEQLIASGVPLERLSQQTQDTIRGCYLVRAGHTVVTRGTTADTVREGVEQALAHFRRNVH